MLPEKSLSQDKPIVFGPCISHFPVPAILERPQIFPLCIILDAIDELIHGALSFSLKRKSIFNK